MPAPQYSENYTVHPEHRYVIWYERRLPHWHPEDASIFLTWRLKGSLPLNCKASSFVAEDTKLDRGDTGPVWLKYPRCAKIVAEAIEYGEAEMRLYKLIAFVVMSNHVHLLIFPLAAIPRITRVLKGYTARKINVVLNRTGEALWQDESFDRWIRNGKDELRVGTYIEMNPVAAGLVHTAEEWLWSTASRRKTDV
jgi:putative transposase